MTTQWMRWSIVGLSAALALLVPSVAAAQGKAEAPAVEAGTTLDFDAASTDLQNMRDLFGGGSGTAVTFNAMAAMGSFNAQHVQLARELTEYTNALMEATNHALGSSIDVTELDVDITKYPLLDFYLDEASRRAEDAPPDNGPLGGEPPPPGDRVEPNSWLSEYYCGAFWRPRPNRAGPWITWYTSNPHGVLVSWGYHTTPSWAGGGYTRDQTYSWALCGFRTFRDHAYILSSGSFREQNYAGWTPRGEPNPEVWRSGPWPYPTWPVYVRWWHSRY